MDPTNEHAVLSSVPSRGVAKGCWMKNWVTTSAGNTNGPGSVSENPARKMLQIVSTTSPLLPNILCTWAISVMMSD